MSTSGKIRNAIIVVNNWSKEDVQRLKSLTYSYIVLADEVGESGTKHIQGYIEFKNPVGFKALTKKLLKRAHIEHRMGTPIQARDYCYKDEQIIFEDGIISKQGKRTDIDKCCELIQDGNRMKAVAQSAPQTFVRYHKGFKALQAILIEPRNEKPNVTVYYGASGTGKSKRAREEMEDPYIWTPQRGQWFDSYEGQKEVIFEEFRGQLPFGMLLSLLDRYDCPVQYKGGTIEFCATSIIITSPLPPSKWYCMSEFDEYDKYEQLERRIDKIIEL